MDYFYHNFGKGSLGVMRLVDLSHDGCGTGLEKSLYALLIHFLVRFLKVAVEHVVQLRVIDADEALTAQVEEQLRAFAVGHDLFHCKDGPQSYALDHSDQVPQVGLLGELKQHLSGKFLRVDEDIRQFGGHQ